MNAYLKKSLSFLIWFIMPFIFVPNPLCQEKNPSVESQLNTLERKYNIKICWEMSYPVVISHGQISGKNPSHNVFERYAYIFIQEFGKYPASFVRRVGLKKIILSENLRFQEQERAAIPDFEHNFLFLDTTIGNYSEEYQRKVIHHDFFHMVDFIDDGKLYQDDDWKKLNPHDFQYGTGGKNMQDDPKSSLFIEEIKGFINRYSTSGVEEDKAEIFANLMVSYPQLTWYLDRDEIIKKKVLRMQNLCSRFSKEMSEEFWESQKWGATVNGLDCQILTTKGTYFKGDIIPVDIIIRNISNNIIKFLVPDRSSQSFCSITKFVIKDSNGNFIRDKSLAQKGTTCNEKILLVKLAPKEVYHITFDNLCRFYNFEREVYQIYVHIQSNLEDPEKNNAWVGTLIPKPIIVELK